MQIAFSLFKLYAPVHGCATNVAQCCITVALVHTINRLEVLVGKKRLELLNLSVLVPKTSAYTNSATCPCYLFNIYSQFILLLLWKCFSFSKLFLPSYITYSRIIKSGILVVNSQLYAVSELKKLFLEGLTFSFCMIISFRS